MATTVNLGNQRNFGFDPRTIPGCVLWLDASDLSTITPSGGGTLSAWTDKSSNALSVTATGATWPTFSLTGFGNKPCMTFASGNRLNVTMPAAYANQDFGMFAVWNHTNTASTATVLSIGAYTAETGIGVHAATGATAYYNIYHYGVAETDTSSIYTANIAAVHSGIRTGTSLSVYANGKSGGIVAVGPDNSGNTSTALYISSSGFPIIGRVCEILLYSQTMTAFMRQQVEGYLAWKWGIQTSLTATQPYAKIPPAMRTFQPSDLPGLSLWLDATDTTTLTPSTGLTSGTSITGWTDKSPNNLTLSFASGSSMTYTPLARNGLPTLAFNGSTVLTTVLPTAFGTGAYSMASVWKVTAALVGNTTVCAASSVSSVNGAQSFIFFGWDGTKYTTTFHDFGQANSPTWIAAPSNNVYLLDVGIRTGSAFIHTQMRDAATPGTTVTATSGGNNLDANVYIAGMKVTGGLTWQLTGEIGEVVIFSGALTTAQRYQLEAYLAYKWGFPYNSVPSANGYYLYKSLPSTPVFSPLQLSGLSLWLDAADSTTIATSGSAVTSWSDKSGNGVTMTNGTGGASRPTYNSTGFNGSYPYIAFSAANASYLTNSSTTLFGNTTFDVYVLWQIAGEQVALFWYDGADRILIINGNGNGSTFGNAPLEVHWGSGGAGAWKLTGNNYVGTTPAMYNINSTGTQLNGFLNTTANGSATQSYPGTTGSKVLYMFDPASGWSANNASICEVIVYSSPLTTAQRQQVEGYLAWKWGLRSLLPTTHPYYKIMP